MKKTSRRAPAVDIHAHYFSEAYLRVLDEQGGAYGITLDRSQRDGPAIRIGAALGGPLRREFYDCGYPQLLLRLGFAPEGTLTPRRPVAEVLDLT